MIAGFQEPEFTTLYFNIQDSFFLAKPLGDGTEEIKPINTGRFIRVDFVVAMAKKNQNINQRDSPDLFAHCMIFAFAWLFASVTDENKYYSLIELRTASQKDACNLLYLRKKQTRLNGDFASPHRTFSTTWLAMPLADLKSCIFVWVCQFAYLRFYSPVTTAAAFICICVSIPVTRIKSSHFS